MILTLVDASRNASEASRAGSPLATFGRDADGVNNGLVCERLSEKRNDAKIQSAAHML